MDNSRGLWPAVRLIDGFFLATRDRMSLAHSAQNERAPLKNSRRGNGLIFVRCKKSCLPVGKQLLVCVMVW